MTRLDVVVPAHDEEDTIAACVDALAAAVRVLHRERPAVEVGVTVVLDGCTDRTAQALEVRATADPTWRSTSELLGQTPIRREFISPEVSPHHTEPVDRTYCRQDTAAGKR